jgi:putative membrane protein
MPSPSSWNLAGDELLLVGALSAAYAVALRFHPASRARIGAFAGSMALVVAASVTPLATLAVEYLLVAHLVQNVVFAEWAPGLAVAGLSAGTAAAIARIPGFRFAVHPFVALPLWVGTYAVWHIPALYVAALERHWLLHLEHACYGISGFLFWWPVLQSVPRAVSWGGRAAYLFAAFVLASPLGLLLGLLPRAIYDFYVEAPRVSGLDPLQDQQIGGFLMAGAEAVVFFVGFVFCFQRFVREES